MISWSEKSDVYAGASQQSSILLSQPVGEGWYSDAGFPSVYPNLAVRCVRYRTTGMTWDLLWFEVRNTYPFLSLGQVASLGSAHTTSKPADDRSRSHLRVLYLHVQPGYSVPRVRCGVAKAGNRGEQFPPPALSYLWTCLNQTQIRNESTRH